MTKSNSRYIFDLGLIFTGILVVNWQVYFMQSFQTLKRIGCITRRAVTIMCWALILAGARSACAGIFRYGMTPFFNIVHGTSAAGMGVMLGLLTLGKRWLVPGYQRVFHYASLASLLIVSAILKFAGFFSLVGLELAAFAIWSVADPFLQQHRSAAGQIRS